MRDVEEATYQLREKNSAGFVEWCVHSHPKGEQGRSTLTFSLSFPVGSPTPSSRRSAMCPLSEPRCRVPSSATAPPSKSSSSAPTRSSLRCTVARVSLQPFH